MPVERKQVKNRRSTKNEYFIDYTLLFIILFLLGFGLLMMYSATSYTAALQHGNSTYFFERQLKAVLIGLGLMVGVAIVPYHFWERFALLGYLVSVVVIFLVRTPLGVTVNGASRWFRIPGIPFQIQSAEIVKLCMILLLATLVCRMGKYTSKLKGVFFLFVVPLPLAILLWKVTNNLSSAIIVMAITAGMIFVADSHYRKYVVIATLALVGIAGFLAFILTQDKVPDGFRIRRITVWLHPESDLQGVGYQTLQGLYAIGSGGIWGKGLGQSMQKLNYLPEAKNDMIFSVICEELGIFGAVALLLMFVLLLWRMMYIASYAPDLFGGMLVVGVISHIAIQVIFNVAVVTNSIPNTGISLPFISYGGSSVVLLLIELGLVLSVAARSHLKEV